MNDNCGGELLESIGETVFLRRREPAVFGLGDKESIDREDPELNGETELVLGRRKILDCDKEVSDGELFFRLEVLDLCNSPLVDSLSLEEIGDLDLDLVSSGEAG